MGIGRNISQYAYEHPQKPAIKQINGETVTYYELYENIKKIQTAFVRMTNKKNIKVGILMGNTSEFLEVFFAVITLGGIAVPFDPKWRKRDIRHVLESGQLDVYIGSRDFLERTGIKQENVMLIDEIKKDVQTDHHEKWEEFDEELFYLGFTSGSTGKPKGYMRNHKSWLESFNVGEQIFGYGKNDVILAPGPLCHSLSLFAAVHALHIGATFYLLPVFSQKETFNILLKREATVFYGVPTMIQALLQMKKNEEKCIMNNVTIISSGAKLSYEARKQLKEMFPNGQLFEFYGASELSFVSYVDDEIFKKAPKSVGIPFPGVEVAIRKKDGSEASFNEVGEVVVRSNLLFSGYFNNPIETKNVLKDDGASIGDLGYLDENGFLTIVGREKNMFISGGLNIYPEEIEKVLKERDEVEEAVVIGVEDDYWGQKPVAFIKWKETAQHRSFNALKRYCRSELPLYKCPRTFYEVDEFPYTSSGKIARKELEFIVKGEEK